MGLVFVFGTTAELIKILPVVELVGEKNSCLVCTGQQGASLHESIDRYGLQEQVCFVVKRRTPLSRAYEVPRWLLRVMFYLLRNFFSARRLTTKEKIAIVVHGDTITALVGTLAGKICRIPVLHIEAGLRSGNIFHPFPEELVRRVIGRLGTIHYAPSDEAVKNLLKAGGEIVCTNGNTSRDSLHKAISLAERTQPNSQEYCVVTLHRSELFGNRQVVRQTFDELIRVAEVITVVLVLDERSEVVLRPFLNGLNKRHGLKSIEVREKMYHDAFIELVASSEFVITDSGGLQEEIAILGIPCLVHRHTTERSDGIGRNVVLSNWREGAISDFAKSYSTLRHEGITSDFSPSQIIATDMIRRGFVKNE